MNVEILRVTIYNKGILTMIVVLNKSADTEYNEKS